MEAMPIVIEDLVPVKMCLYITVDDMFQQLAGYGSYGYWGSLLLCIYLPSYTPVQYMLLSSLSIVEGGLIQS